MTVIATKIPALRFSEFEGEWEEKKLGVCAIKIGSGSTPKGGESVYQKVGIPFIRSQNVNNNRLDLSRVTFISEEINAQMSGTIVQPLDLLLNITGASIGRSCVVPKFFEGGNVNQHVCIVRLKKNYSPFFIQAKLSSFAGQKAIIRNQVGGSREGLNFQSVRLLKFDLPSFLEQQKITAFLSTIDTRIHQLSRKKALLEQYKKGVTQQIFSQEIRFKDEDGKEFPAWEEKKLGVLTYKVGRKNKQGAILPIYSINNKEGFLPQSDQFDGVDSNERGYDISLYKVVNANTFAYNPARINVGSIGYSGNLNEVIISSLYVCFKTKDSLDDQFLLSYLNTFEFNKAVLRNAEGGVRSYLFYENFSKIKIPLPSLPEQQKIAAFLSTIDRQINLANQQLNRMQTFKKGLLQQMFV